MNDKKINKEDKEVINYLYENEEDSIVENNNDIANIDNTQVSLNDVDFNLFKNYDNISITKKDDMIKISYEEQDKIKNLVQKENDGRTIKTSIEVNKNNFIYKRILSLKDDGLSPKQIAEFCKCDLSYVYKVLRENNK